LALKPSFVVRELISPCSLIIRSPTCVPSHQTLRALLRLSAFGFGDRYDHAQRTDDGEDLAQPSCGLAGFQVTYEAHADIRSRGELVLAQAQVAACLADSISNVSWMMPMA